MKKNVPYLRMNLGPLYSLRVFPAPGPWSGSLSSIHVPAQSVAWWEEAHAVRSGLFKRDGWFSLTVATWVVSFLLRSCLSLPTESNKSVNQGPLSFIFEIHIVELLFPTSLFYPRLLAVDSCHDNCTHGPYSDRLRRCCFLTHFSPWINLEVALFLGFQGGSLQGEARQASHRNPVKWVLWGSFPLGH